MSSFCLWIPTQGRWLRFRIGGCERLVGVTTGVRVSSANQSVNLTAGNRGLRSFVARSGAAVSLLALEPAPGYFSRFK